jgi:AcrR family transcriptional regulator
VSERALAGQARLDTETVVDAAERLVSQQGWSALTMAALAEALGVRPPALYRHVGSLDDLRIKLNLRLIDGMVTAVRSAVMAQSREDGLRALARAYRRFAHEHAGLFRAPLPFDHAEVRAQFARAGEAAHAVLRSFGLDDEQIVIATAQLAAVFHGFVVIELANGLEWVDAERAFDGLIDLFADAMNRLAAKAVTGPH